MKISKKDALIWFRFFAELPEDEPPGCRQQEIALAVFAQIETAVEARRQEMLRTIPGLMAVVPGAEKAVPWSPDRPALCAALITLAAGGQTLDTKYERFGWRQFTLQGRDLLLNG